MFNPYRHTQDLDQPFSFNRLYRHPGDFSRYDPGGQRQRIAIIGGGISGLVSAYELTQLKHHVTVLEADSRLGGRIKTHYFNDGTYGELGAMRIPSSHQCVMYYIEKFALEIQGFISYNSQAFYHLRGQKSRIDAYDKLFSRYHVQPAERQDPATIYDTLLKELIESFSETEKWELFSPEFTSPCLRHYDGLSLTQFFRDRISPDMFEFVGHATGMIHYEQVSLLNGLIDFFAWYRAKQYKLVGGLETLVNAFLKRLPGNIISQAQVSAIEMTDTGVRLHWTGLRGRQTAEFDAVICTVPATALANIEFDPPLPQKQAYAINNLGYCSAAKTLFHCTARPWEFADGIHGGGSFTDLNIEKCWYPSDNARIADTSSAEPRWVGLNPDKSYQSAALTAAYRWEQNAREFRDLAVCDRTEHTLNDLKQLHPQIESYVDQAVHHIWDEVHQPGSGAYAFFAPGEREQFQGWLGLPYLKARPRVFFAGEHLAINHASVQGAVQTALSATIDYLETL
ncbi:MAG: NAD(P)/FAD-dependent oxidoreductase [Cyanobacteria bacterium P01_B01_bin.77]